MLGDNLQLLMENRTHTFTSSSHETNLSSKMLCFYEQQAFCDITLVPSNDGNKIQAHRIVLSASSEFFSRMFFNPMAEATAKEVKLNEIDGDTLKVIVDFMYKGSIQLRSDSVEAILKAADFLQMNVLKSACCDFIAEEVNASNCLSVSIFAENRNILELQQKAFLYACSNFEEVCAEQEFLQLDGNQLKKLIMSDDLYASSEEHVFHNVVRWVNHDKENRGMFAFSLMECIRFTFLDADFLLENRNLICNSVETLNLLCTWVHWFLNTSKRKDYKVIMPRQRREKIAFLNGNDSHDIKMQVYDRNLDAWSFVDLPYPQKKRREFAAIVLKNKLYIVGGRIHIEETASVDFLDLDTKKWGSLPSMPIPRNYPSLVTVEGDLYVLGGYIGPQDIQTMIKFNFTTNKWQGLASLREPYPVSGVAVHKHYIFAYCNSRHFVDRYDIYENIWDQRNHSVNQFDQRGFGVVEDHLYTVGGHDRYTNSVSSQAERYWTVNNRWTFISSLNKPRCQIKCIALENKLIACGGFDDNYFTNIVEEYDPKTDTWTMLAPFTHHKLDLSFSNLFML